MKKLYPLLFLLCFGSSLHAQQYFNKFYSLHAVSCELNSVLEYNNKFYAIGTSWDSSIVTRTFGLVFAVFDHEGNLLFDSVFQKPHVRQYNSLMNNNTLQMLPDKTLLYGVSLDISDSTGEGFALLLRYDTLGHVLSQREYSKPTCRDTVKWYSISDIQPTGTGEWLMLCWTTCYNPSTVMPDYFELSKLDRNFNIEWTRTYGSMYLLNRPGKITIDKDGGYLLGGMVTNDLSFSLSAFYRADIIKTDTSGNQLWEWRSNPSKLTYTIKDLIRTKDKGYIYCSMGNGYMESVGSPVFKTWIQKLDSNLNPVWFDTLGIGYATSPELPFVRLIELEDSSVVTGACVYGGFNDDLPPYLHTYAGLIRYRPDGSKIFHHKYYLIDLDGINSREDDFNMCSDGGYIVAGVDIASRNHRGWLVRVDSNGCMGLTDTGCHNLHAPLVQNETINCSIFPNPATSYINIDFNRLPQGLSLEISNMLGQSLLTRHVINQTERIDISNFNNGVYLCRIIYQGNTITTQRFVKMSGE